MPARVQFLSVDDVLFIHQDTIENEGGSPGILNLGLLESAVAMPQQQYHGEWLHGDLAAMAAAYLFHIAQNHPFEDGNKRTAAMSMLVFLDANGAKKRPKPAELEAKTMKMASSQSSKEELTVWMRDKIK